MIRQNDLDKGKVHFGLFVRALKDAPRDMVSVHVEGTEVGFCGDILADKIEQLMDERKAARRKVAFYQRQHNRVKRLFARIGRVYDEVLDEEAKSDENA